MKDRGEITFAHASLCIENVILEKRHQSKKNKVRDPEVKKLVSFG